MELLSSLLELPGLTFLRKLEKKQKMLKKLRTNSEKTSEKLGKTKNIEKLEKTMQKA